MTTDRTRELARLLVDRADELLWLGSGWRAFYHAYRRSGRGRVRALWMGATFRWRHARRMKKPGGCGVRR